ncbi:glycosyltransferase family 2 protein [Bradyrhizobium sp. Ec3.3]|uniref:glycosyltransferase family 2 protein n=1 Tax=Bradyrhizobium sp. Ec3.3 TaxID=189753 RepID=UPI0006891BB3|nr:glycosyltransferase family 2 protein [Bradyrhizobium sp. Ec3.3]
MIEPKDNRRLAPDPEGPAISVIVPIFNEEGSIVRLCDELLRVLDSIGRSFEVICVNDGSTDRSMGLLQEIANRRKELRVVSFCRNYGQTAAMMAGIDYARGRVIISIDADLQNDPQDIPELLAKMDEGFDVVSGWRKERYDATIRRNFVSRVANRIISRISGVHLHDYGCTLKAYRREMVKDVRLYGEMHRFVPIYVSWMGARLCEIPVRHHARKFDKSKYGIERILKVILDLVVVKFLDRYLVKPIYLFGGFGLLSLLLSISLTALMIWLKLCEDVSMVQTPILPLTALTFLIGVQSILLGLIAEILARTYFEARERRAYTVRETFNFQTD